MVVGHVGAIHGTQRNPHGGRNRRLRHPTLAQQYYLDALALLRRHFPPQCRFQSPDLALAAFDHLFPRIRCSTGNHRNRLTLGTQIPQIADSISYGVGMTSDTTLKPCLSACTVAPCTGPLENSASAASIAIDPGFGDSFAAKAKKPSVSASFGRGPVGIITK